MLPFSLFQPLFLVIVLVRAIIAVAKHHGQKHLEEDRVYLVYISQILIHGERPVQELILGGAAY